MGLKPILLSGLMLLPLPAWGEQYIMYVGSYTAGPANATPPPDPSKGIYAWRFDSKDGSISPLGLVAETSQPAHLWIAPNGKTLYSVNWETNGGVSSYRIDPKSGALTFLNKTSSHGAQPNQVMVDPSGRVAVTVNYTSGSLAAYKLEPDGKLGELVDLVSTIGFGSTAGEARDIEDVRSPLGPALSHVRHQAPARRDAQPGRGAGPRTRRPSAPCR
jgi:6-phosphogluconolactonase